MGGNALAGSGLLREDLRVRHLTADELQTGLPHVLRSPTTEGVLRVIALRPAMGERLLVERADLTAADGVAGDNWLPRGSRQTEDGSADPERQVTVMNIRIAELVAGTPERAPLAGDQLYVDFDLSEDNLPAGAHLAIGSSVLRVSEAPHLGCAKFVERFGPEAMRFVNSREGRRLRLRGLNARVLTPGEVRLGDTVTRVAVAQPEDIRRADRESASR
jgi:hypothetical protein